VEEIPSWYRRPLPGALIPFSSPRGRALFREALEAGTLESFFPLIEQFHTQADPAFCGLGSLVMALNALGIDPGRAWRGPWRWFSEELLDCCTPLEKVRQKGVSIEELACLARCNGAGASIARPADGGVAALREATLRATQGTEHVLIASYSRSALEQTGAGHYSPIGGYHAGEDLALVLDVARFKYPPYWVKLEALLAAMRDVDADTGRPRGWVLLERRGAPSAVARFLVCSEGMWVKRSLAGMIELQRAALELEAPATLEALLLLQSRLVQESGLMDIVRFRPPQTSEHQRLLEQLTAELSELALHGHAAKVLEPSAVTPTMIWMLGAPLHTWRGLPEGLASQVAELVASDRMPPLLGAEVSLLSSQIEFLLEHV
jgi:glutathione gamma-glutamylcysteinyltransferase